MNIVTEKANLEAWLVTPIPGYVLKFKEVKMLGLRDQEKRKAFVNICHCSDLPPPMDDLDENQLAAQVDSGNLSFRVPLSIGEMDCVRDNKNENALKIDVLINTVFYEKRIKPKEAEFMRHFLCMVICEAIANKHSVELDSNHAVMLLNRKKMGEIEPMRISRKPQSSMIQEVDLKAGGSSDAKRCLVEEASIPETENLLKMKQPEGVSIRLMKGERLEFKFDLNKVTPSVTDVKRLRLRMNADRIVISLDNCRSLYDVTVPFNMDVLTVRSKLSLEKNALFLTADIVYPG